MNDEIREILAKFNKVLENYELDKKFGQMSVDSICHLFPNEMIAIKDYITNLQKEVRVNNDLIPHFKNRAKELKKEITNLQKENERLKKELNDISNISYKDYSVWATERRYLDTLDEFANDIKYKIAPNLTDSYRDGIKSALKHTIKYVKDNYKQETLEDYKSRVEKATEKLSFIDEALENDTLNVPLCIAKINSALNILQNGSEK